MYFEGIVYKYTSDVQDNEQIKMWADIHRVQAVITFDERELEQISLLRQVCMEFGDQAQHFVSIMRKGKFVRTLDRLTYLVRRCAEDRRFLFMGATVPPAETGMENQVFKLFTEMCDVVGEVPARVHGVWAIALALGYKNEDVLSPQLMGTPKS